MERFDLAVIGGGIVGLATALELTRRNPGRSLVLLEKEPTLAGHQSSHNSGVIHSGLYYTPGSAKARLAIRGAELMRAFCREQAIPVLDTGKVVVATREDQLERLAELQRRGEANGVPDLRRLNTEQLREIEPEAAGIAALHVPGTASVDYGRVARRMGELVRDAGAELRTSTRLLGIHREEGGLRLVCDTGELRVERLVACAGLHSDRVASSTTARRDDLRIVPFRGEYYRLREPAAERIRGLIYPVPDPSFPFLGVHLTRTVDGIVEAGPNAVLALSREGYRRGAVRLRDLYDTLTWPGFWRLAGRYWRTGLAEELRSLSSRLFLSSLQELVPALGAGDIERAGAGVRAQALGRDGALLSDFAFAEAPGMLHVLNAPSPAATASLAIAREIADRLESKSRDG